MLMLDKVDDFLSSHELQIRIPKEIISGSIAPFVPSALMKNIPQEMRIPLAEPETGKGNHAFFVEYSELLESEEPMVLRYDLHVD